MPRPTDGPVARSEQLSLRVTSATKVSIDRLRGTLSRSEYIRRLVMRDARTRGTRSTE